ncbi:hypothetical protein SprV_0301227800 [Sparganum proliferum]
MGRAVKSGATIYEASLIQRQWGILQALGAPDPQRQPPTTPDKPALSKSIQCPDRPHRTSPALVYQPPDSPNCCSHDRPASTSTTAHTLNTAAPNLRAASIIYAETSAAKTITNEPDAPDVPSVPFPLPAMWSRSQSVLV